MTELEHENGTSSFHKSKSRPDPRVYSSEGLSSDVFRALDPRTRSVLEEVIEFCAFAVVDNECGQSEFDITEMVDGLSRADFKRTHSRSPRGGSNRMCVGPRRVLIRQ